MEFYAAFKGVDLNKDNKEVGDRFEAVQRRAAERLAGASQSDVERSELSAFGIDFETE